MELSALGVDFIKIFFDAEQALSVTSLLPKNWDPSASGTLVNVQKHPSENPGGSPL